MEELLKTQMVTGHFQYPDEINCNRGRIYPRELVDKAVEDFIYELPPLKISGDKLTYKQRREIKRVNKKVRKERKTNSLRPVPA